jgi:hypothetical protein
MLFSSLVIDGFPAGIDVLREFGSRLTNFILLVIIAALLFKRLASKSAMTFTRKDILFGGVVLCGIPAVNLPIALLQAGPDISGPIADWSKQYGMLLWGLASFWAWKRLVNAVSPVQLGALICWGSVLPLICFFGDLLGIGVIQGMLVAVRTSITERASGLATEPSLYSAWLAFVWPLVLFYVTRAGSSVKRLSSGLLLLGLCVSAYLSNARTIAVIVVLQIMYYAYWVTRNRSGLYRLRSLVILIFIGIAILAVFAGSFSTLTSMELGSNISRIGSTMTALRVSLAHPVVGVGIGQFKYFFGAYAPDFALVSDEILSYVNGTSEFRASSFNLFVRFACEFGIPVGMFFSALVLYPIITAVRRRDADRFVFFATLAAIGGVGFWLTQDQYGYQPAILSLAILSNAVRSPNARRPSDVAGIREVIE